MSQKSDTLRKKVRETSETVEDVDEFSSRVVELVNDYDTDYDWVGIYLATDDETLVLPEEYYVGPETQHTEIDFEDGICGATARARETIVVDDVNEDPRYIACSVSTESEIVVPIIEDGELYGVLDLDSDAPAYFDDEDREILEYVADVVAEFYGRKPPIEGEN